MSNEKILILLVVAYRVNSSLGIQGEKSLMEYANLKSIQGRLPSQQHFACVTKALMGDPYHVLG